MHVPYELWFRESQMQSTKAEWLVNFSGGDDPIFIRRSKDPFGWMGNMSPYPMKFGAKDYRTSEALFQCLRTDDEDVRIAIRAEKSPMAAKLVAKTNADKRTIECLTDADLDLMRLTLREKVKQYPHLSEQLLDTGDRVIIEDCSKRQRGSGLFWGAAEQEDGTWTGMNWLGRLWMELREEIRKSRSVNSMLDLL